MTKEEEDQKPLDEENHHVKQPKPGVSFKLYIPPYSIPKVGKNVRPSLKNCQLGVTSVIKK